MSVSTAAGPAAPASAAEPPARLPRFNLRPGVPDVSILPRDAWLRSVRRALAIVIVTLGRLP
jgi:GntR family transcriptional regulator/MocR family aminotransferase